MPIALSPNGRPPGRGTWRRWRGSVARWVALVAVPCALLVPAPPVLAHPGHDREPPAAAGGATAPSGLNLTAIRTDDLLLVHGPDTEGLAAHVLRTYHQALQWNRRVFGWTPSDRPALWLRDFSDTGNANVTTMPRNTMRMEVAPMSSPFETAPSAERIYSTMNHEMVHMAMGDVADARDRFWRGLFQGKVVGESEHPESLLYSWLTVPRWTAPRWYLEGSAVFLETWMGGGLGRAQAGYDEMVFRAMVRDGAPFHDPMSLVSRAPRVDFQAGVNAYLYGTRFFTWLAHGTSPEQVLQWLRRDEGSRAHYAHQFERVFGEPIEAAWARWVQDERAFQQANLAAVRRHPVTPRQPLVDAPLGSVSRAFVDETAGELIAAVRMPGIADHLAAVDLKTGRRRVLTDIRGATFYDVSSVAFDAGRRTVFFTTDNAGHRTLWSYDLARGERRRLLHEARIGALAFVPGSGALLGVRHEGGLAQLVRVPPPYTEGWQVLHTFPYGEVPADLDVSPDGTRVAASVLDARGDQYLRVWRTAPLMQGDLQPLSEFRFSPAAPEGFVFSPDGRHLYGSAYYTGVSNIFRYEVETGRVAAVSNAETGFFRPLPRPDGRLVVFEYTGQGFQPVLIDPQPVAGLGTVRFLGAELAARHPVVRGWQVPAARAVDETALIRSSGPYEPLHDIGLLNVYPVLQGYRDARGGGLRANFGDPAGFARVGLVAAVTPGQGLDRDDQLHLELSVQYIRWQASLSWNRSSFYDLFGPTKRGRRGLAFTLGRDTLLMLDGSSTLDWRWQLAWRDKLDSLPDAQNVQARVDHLASAETGLHYRDLRRSVGALEEEQGIQASATVRLTRAAGRLLTQPQLRLDLGLPTPVPRLSLWSRTALGGTAGTQALPLAQHYFGAFGNNTIDDGVVRRFREPGSMPGFEIDALGGRHYARQMVELSLPPWVFESAGWPGLHLQSLRPAVFVAGLWTQPASGARWRRHASVGAQIDLRLPVLHWYDMTLSIGHAAGFEGSRRTGREWMLSLKLL